MFTAKMDYLREIFAQEWATVQRRESYKKFFEQNKAWLVGRVPVMAQGGNPAEHAEIEFQEKDGTQLLVFRAV